MNNRVVTVVLAAMLVTLSSGCCSSMSNLWFGRGARCGLCNTLSSNVPRFGNCLKLPCREKQCASPAPQCSTPYQSVPYQSAPYQGVQQPPQWKSPAYSSAPASDCGCNNYAGIVNEGSSYGSSYGGDCNGQCGVEGYGNTVHDPYLSGDSIPLGGGQGVPGNFAPIESDDFQSRKFDTDGNKILWEEPLPSGTVAQ